MSYILDALRKSEQQRQATQPDTVTERILINLPVTQKHSRKWWLILIFGNLVVLTALFWYLAQKKPQPAPQVPVTVPVTPIVQAPVATPQITETPIISPVTDEPAPSPSIADMMSSQETVKIEQRPNKPITEKKLAPVKKLPIKNQPRHIPIRGEYAYEEPMQEYVPTYSPSPSTPQFSSATPPKKAKLSINVFNYAQQPEERFVIINMIKYKVGQQIDGETTLKEIHSDHIVLQQGSTAFKMNRP